MSLKGESRGEYKPVTDYVSALRGEEFNEMDSEKAWKIVRVVVGECLGSAVFIGLGCGSLVAFPGSEAVSTIHVVLAFAFALTLTISTFGHISGSFVNPSLALSAMVIGKISLPMFFVYTISECVGATLGVAVIKAISPEGCVLEGFCMTQPHAAVSVVQALSVETLLTFCICMLFLSCVDEINSDKQDSVPLKFGAAIIVLAITGGKYTGGSMNPARSLGPALLSGTWQNQWIYWVGPLTGALLAGLLYRFVLLEEKEKKTEKRLDEV